MEWGLGGHYLEWPERGECPLPLKDGYEDYMRFVSKFPKSEKAKQMAIKHAENIVGRTNRYTGKPYPNRPLSCRGR